MGEYSRGGSGSIRMGFVEAGLLEWILCNDCTNFQSGGGVRRRRGGGGVLLDWESSELWVNNRIHFINLIRDKETFYLCFEAGSWVVELETKIERLFFKRNPHIARWWVRQLYKEHPMCKLNWSSLAKFDPIVPTLRIQDWCTLWVYPLHQQGIWLAKLLLYRNRRNCASHRT